MGDPAGADELYEEAQDDLTAKEMRAFAWLEVQRGFLDFARGRYRQARSHYDRADAAYPGYWLVDEHVAELLAAQDRYARTPLPFLNG
jgi:tetratricopeptide (TPR) repeat protein